MFSLELGVVYNCIRYYLLSKLGMLQSVIPALKIKVSLSQLNKFKPPSWGHTPKLFNDLVENKTSYSENVLP